MSKRSKPSTKAVANGEGDLAQGKVVEGKGKGMGQAMATTAKPTKPTMANARATSPTKPAKAPKAGQGKTRARKAARRNVGSKGGAKAKAGGTGVKGKGKASASGAKAKASANGKAKGQPGKLTALDAAAKVLAKAGRAMTAKELIVVMAKKGYWTTPNGKTPEATLNAMFHKEMKARGKQARFRKVERGKFAIAK